MKGMFMHCWYTR